MKVRKITTNGDYSMGHGNSDFLSNTPEAVAQNVKTRLALWQGQWFLDIDEGTPWLQEILGKHDAVDAVIKNRILETPGVLSISSFESIFNSDERRMTFTVVIDTEYGEVSLEDEIQ